MDKVLNKTENQIIEIANTTKNAAAVSSFFLFMFLILGFITAIFSSHFAVKTNYKHVE